MKRPWRCYETERLSLDTSTPIDPQGYLAFFVTVHKTLRMNQKWLQQPSEKTVHACLVLAQVFFGLGSVVGALGLPSMNPLAFALYREIAASIILLLGVALLRQESSAEAEGNEDTTKSSSKNIMPTGSRRRFVVLGACVFGNQAAFILGLKLAGPVAAAVWQPSQPILTAAICMLMGWELPNARRVTGVLVAFAGCAAMVVLSGKGGGDDTDEGATSSSMHALVGSFFFLINCLCTSLYIILSKTVLKIYSPLTVTAWSYTIAAAIMTVTCCLTSLSTRIMTLLCPEDCAGPWHLPPGAYFAMAYFVIFVSVLSYCMVTWANQHVTGTLVTAYSVLQPVTAAVLTIALLTMGVYPACVNVGDGSACLDPPGWGAALGMLGVFCGLFLIVSTEPRNRDNDSDAKYEDVANEEAQEMISLNQLANE